MTHTQDFEDLLDCKNVLGVEYEEETNTLTVFVSQKLPESELADEDNVEKRVADADVELKVEDAGYGDEREGFDALSLVEPIPEADKDRKDRHRPVVGGVSEINAKSTAATAGPYPARVTDASKANWSDAVSNGDLVRLSNNHVYARVNKAQLGEPIVQPSPRDGGGLPDDKTGELRGYVTVEDGSLVDVAARSADPERESPEYHELDDSWPTGVRREGYRSLKGETVTKTGRTTGVTQSQVRAVGASVRVNFGEAGTLTLRDQIIAGAMSKGGDSGSPVFHDSSGELVGLLFAGSKRQTIFNKIGNVESELGVELLTEEPGGGGGGVGGGGDGGGKGGDTSPTYRETFDTTVTVSMNSPELSLESFSVRGSPSPGAAVDATAAVSGTAPGTGWLEVQGTRTTFELTEKHARGGKYRRDVAVTLTVPESPGDSFEVRVEGGYVDSA
ncbi:S1 family peptidase [Haladaptatus salinisoli]|uniref:S1 family peptidase n=1 Tax=Haladaptatus salinisoli TaxID=2884876 RepID=UPI001D09EBC9|nr:S1 family peptidase [Haladaptatus salinisoli]